jgi:hypothetical protein
MHDRGSGTVENPEHIRLQAPGAGLPLIEHLFSRYYWLPKYFRKTSWETAHSFFQKQGAKLLRISERVSTALRQQRVLVPRMTGIEDSSRYWSVAMVLEHLMIVGDLMSEIIFELSHGRVPDLNLGIADVKPKGALPGDKALADYEAFLERFRTKVMNETNDRSSKAKLKHPWFGRLTAHEWLCIAALHQRVHRKQAEAILKRGT